MELTDEQRVELTARLAEAEKAYHELQIGRSARIVVYQNGERVEFTAANKQGLYNYIQQLRTQLGLNSSPSIACNYGPARFLF